MGVQGLIFERRGGLGLIELLRGCSDELTGSE